MHTTFQQELVKLRLATAKAYMKVLTDGQVLPTLTALYALTPASFCCVAQRAVCAPLLDCTIWP